MTHYIQVLCKQLGSSRRLLPSREEDDEGGRHPDAWRVPRASSAYPSGGDSESGPAVPETADKAVQAFKDETSECGVPLWTVPRGVWAAVAAAALNFAAHYIVTLSPSHFKLEHEIPSHL
jgi:hypothetical protein